MADSYTGMNEVQIPAATIGSRIIQNVGGAFGSALITTIVTAYAKRRVKTFENGLKYKQYQGNAIQMKQLIQQHLAHINLESYQFGFLIISISAIIIILPTLLLSNKMSPSKKSL